MHQEFFSGMVASGFFSGMVASGFFLRNKVASGVLLRVLPDHRMLPMLAGSGCISVLQNPGLVDSNRKWI